MAFATHAEEVLSSATHSAQFQAGIAYLRKSPHFKVLQRLIQTNPLLAQAVSIAAPTLMQTEIAAPNQRVNNKPNIANNVKNGRNQINGNALNNKRNANTNRNTNTNNTNRNRNNSNRNNKSAQPLPWF